MCGKKREIERNVFKVITYCPVTCFSIDAKQGNTYACTAFFIFSFKTFSPANSATS